MPRFFFHLREESGLIPDEEGREFPTLAEARLHALEGIRSIMSDEVKAGRIDLSGQLEIADDRGTALLTLSFDEAVEIHHGETPRR